MLPPLSPLPSDVQQWLNDTRLMTDETIKSFGIGFIEHHGNPWVAFPVRDTQGEMLFYKLKGTPANTSPNKGLVHPAGSEATLFGQEYLSGLAEGSTVLICEGEPDCILLWQAGLTAVTSTGGAATWRDEWTALLPKNATAVLVFDHDDAGEKGREKVRTSLQESRPDVKLMDIRFGEETQKGYDITDFFRGLRDDGEPMKRWGEILMANAVPYSVTVKRDRTIAKVQTPASLMGIDEWRQAILREFPRFLRPAETCLSVLTQVLIHDAHNPFALVLTDRASTGKTICVDFFDNIKDITYSTDHFTPAAFVSSIAGRSEKQLEKIDLLPRIRHKTLLVREMATLLTESEDTLRQRMGQLTRVLDGDGYTTESGVYGQRGYKGDYMFGMLMASTPFPLRVWKLMSGLGHRLFFMGLSTPEADEEELMMQTSGGSFRERVKRCQQATDTLVRSIWSAHPEGVEWQYGQDDQEAKRTIARMAIFLAHFRGEIVVYKEWSEDGGREIASTKPHVEHPSRINQCLYNLARGHALACGRSHITGEDIRILYPIIIATAADPRPDILRELLSNVGELSVTQIMDNLKMAKDTAKKEMHKLIQLGVCDGIIEKDTAFDEWDNPLPMGVGHKKNHITLKDRFRWLVSDEHAAIFSDMGLIR